MASGPLTEEQVFGPQPVYGQGAAAPDAPPAIAPQAQPVIARPLPNVPGYVSDPSFTPAPGAGPTQPFGQAPAVRLGGQQGLSDTDVFGPNGAGQQAAADNRPVSQTLGFGEGVHNVLKNAANVFDRPGPMAFMPLGDIRGVAQDVLSLPARLAVGTMKGPLDQMAKTSRPGLAGKIGGELLASAPFAMEGGPMLMGAAQGYLTSESNNPFDKAANMAEGAVGGKVGDKVFGALGSVAAPKVRDAAQWAIDHGIRLTPGAITGGPLASIENNVLSKLAFAGPMVRNGQIRTIEDFNKATVNNALAPAGLSLPSGVAAGSPAIDKAHTMLGDAYDAILPKLTLTADPKFGEAVSNMRGAASDLDGPYAARFTKVLDDKVLPKFASGSMSGQDMKTLDTYLGQQSRRFGKAQDPFAQEYGDALTELHGHLRDLTQRSNPDYADQLSGLNNGWAQLVRIEKAGTTAATQGGVFTPDGLINAARATDSSARGNATARGQALLQDWANQAKNVVPSKMPAGGSPLSNIMEGLVTLGVGRESGMHGVGAAAAVEAALSGMYSKPGQAALRAAMTQRPQMARDLVARLQGIRPVAGYAGATTTPNLLPPPQAALPALLPLLSGPPQQ